MGVRYWKPSQSLNGDMILGTNTNVGFIVVPFSGKVRAIYSALLTATSADDDEAVSFAVSGGTTMGAITIAGGSAAGVVDSLAVTGNNAVVAGDTIDITTDGGNDDASVAVVTVIFDDVK